MGVPCTLPTPLLLSFNYPGHGMTRQEWPGRGCIRSVVVGAWGTQRKKKGRKLLSVVMERKGRIELEKTSTRQTRVAGVV